MASGAGARSAEKISEPWQRAAGPWRWSFPRDHGAHPNFKTEWWYLTGNLKDTQSGDRFGYQLTLFRQGIQFQPARTQSRWAIRDLYFGHFTISDVAHDRFLMRERLSRGALGEAKCAINHMDVTLQSWSIDQNSDQTMHLLAQEANMGIDFQACPVKPLILEGKQGLSQKGEAAGESSYYYSYPRLETKGTLRLGDRKLTVEGLSWFDHEFSTSSLAKDEVGWDWFCLQLDDHEEVMLYALRDQSGKIDAASEGTWVNANGSSERLPPGSFTITRTATWHSAASGATYPAGWRISIPGKQAELRVSPLMADQELRLSRLGALDYWEGACSNGGKVAGRVVTGVGYTELTGYSGTLQQDFK